MIWCFKTPSFLLLFALHSGDPILSSRLLISSQNEVSMSKHKQTEHLSCLCAY
ncbi:uncharacterized protein J3R85_005998 [Psidium guajava]|nr:uncharacterized protein J3R85_005998 [Psidium guajava]